MRGEGCLDLPEHRILNESVRFVDFDFRLELEVRCAIPVDPDRDPRVAGRRELRDECLLKLAIILDGASVDAAKREVYSTRIVIESPGGERLADAYIGSREVLIVAERHDAPESQYG